MKCAYHPNKEAVTRCSLCQKPLCEECASSADGKDVVCSRCSILEAARDASQGVDERREEMEEKRLSRQARSKRKSRILTVALLALSVLVLAGNLYFYLKVRAPAAREFDPYEDLMVTADLVNDAILDYARDHNGKVPENLSDLPARYLPSEKIDSSVLAKLSYTRISDDAYELRAADPSGEADSEFTFTEEDL